MRRRSPAGRRCPARPLDEERERRIGGGLLDAGEAPAELSTVPGRPRARGDAHSQSLGDLVEPFGANRPPEWQGSSGRRPRHPPPERASRRFGFVDDSDQLEVVLAERHDPVGSSPAWMTAALDRREAVPGLELPRGCGEIGDGDQDVVEVQSRERSPPTRAAASTR